MPRIALVTACALSLALALTATSNGRHNGALAAEEEAALEKFTPLYNGTDLSGWAVRDGKKESWAAEGETLSCVTEGGGWLVTEKKYSDFILKLDYRIPAGGNSGVGLRLPESGPPHNAGMEIQILDDEDPQYKDIKPAQHTGSIYYQVAAKRGATKPPGEWNSYEILCAGPLVRITLNGEVITEASLDKQTKAEGEDIKPLSERPEIGAIGLQSHGSRVDFRNVQIQDLATTTKSGLQYYDIVAGKGDVVEPDARVTVHYSGRLTNGKLFDSSRARGEPITFPLNGVILGWREGVAGMKVGGRRKLIIPSKLGYGEQGAGADIPPNSTLIFDVEVLETN